MCNSTNSTLLCIAVAALYFIGINGKEFCDSPQYLELAKTGTINCLFRENFFRVLWYNTTEYTINDPLVDYHGFIKTGKGYTSGEFDVDTNGSLVINRVSLEHESTFTVAYIHSEEAVPVFIPVEVVVTVKPLVPFPVFENCGNSSNVCYASIIQPALHCTLPFVRPAVPLYIVARTVSGDRNLTDTTTFTPQGGGFTSRVISTDIFKFSNLLVLLVCKTSTPTAILENDESFLLAQNSNISLSSMEVIVRYIEQNSTIKLSCADINASFILWKKGVSLGDKTTEVLLYSLNTGKQFTKVFADDVTLEGNASLVLSETKVQQSGFYYCLFGDGVKDGAKFYEVVVLVYPMPAYPIVDGCDLPRKCVLEAAREGSLNCSINGIHPKVQLEWQVYPKDDASVIYFSNHNLTTKKNGETFDITLTSSYTLKHETLHGLTIACRVTSSKEVPFQLATEIDLLFGEADLHPTETFDMSPTSSFIWAIAVGAAVAILLLSCFGLGVVINKCVCKEKKSSLTGDEEMSLILMKNQTEGDRFSERKDKFLMQIKEKYRDQYDGVQPIPYIKDRLYCVDKVFVEGGIEYLDAMGAVTKFPMNILKSYNDLFGDERVKSKRRILEGEPGYGKSTITLQFAYDWCNSVATSPLRDVEILILLRLRQLGGVPSIYTAIKHFLLPKESDVSESDVKDLLSKSRSVVIILDGFDEYPDYNDLKSDVNRIIAKDQFCEYEVVLTTRSSFLPNNYPASTQRVRLTGFDENARTYYLRKAVVGDNDDKSVRQIEEYLEENPILKDLCQVPLLFVIFAHMTYESEQFRKLNSVTSFFRYMISCFHSHMRNKMNDENARKYELFENNHQSLDKLAFESFSGQYQKIVWEKEEMSQKLGQEFYDQYIRIGILIEEESIDIIDDPGTPITEHVQYKRGVRFYHKLFGEWYAAHHLAEYLQQNTDVNLSEFLGYLDPFDVQYLYRFTCGIYPASAEKIVDYLKSTEGGDKFAILCILEQTGKIDDIKETIQQLCDEGIVISGHDSLLLQRSSLQLLEIAVKNKIPIKYVGLNDCFQTVDLSIAAIRTTSDLVFPSRVPVEKLAVTSYNREMTKDEYISILRFSSKCVSLRHLRFGGCVPPLVIRDEGILLELQTRKINVCWRMRKDYQWYLLNHTTGRWENEVNRKELDEKTVQSMKAKFRQQLKSAPEGFHKREVQMMRSRMRESNARRNEII